MRLRPGRAIYAATGITVAALIGGLTAVPAAQDKPLLAEQVFKNIQVLRGIPVDDFLGTMGIMAAALQFDCSDCHVAAGTEKVDWAADTPRKQMARVMVTMVATINKTHFGGRQVVTCWTCHRNRDKPLVTPDMATIYGTPVVERDDVLVQAPGAPSPESILDRYIQAAGGAQRLAGLTSFVGKGTSVSFGGFGGGGDVELVAQAPDKRATIILFKKETGRGDQIRTYDGRAGWLRTPLNVLGEFQLTGTDLDGARVDAQLSFPGQIKQILTNLRAGPPTTITDLPAPSSQSALQQGVPTDADSRGGRGPGDRAERAPRHVVFRQAERTAPARVAVRQLAHRPHSDADRLRRLSRCQRNQAAVPDHVRMAGRTRLDRSERDRDERADRCSEVRATGAADAVGRCYFGAPSASDKPRKNFLPSANTMFLPTAFVVPSFA